MKRISLFLLSMALISSACSQDLEMIDFEAAVESAYTITAIAEKQTRVSASYDKEQSRFDFKWSTGDIIYVTVFEEGTTMTEELVSALPTYEFTLKSGAGSDKATFSCPDFIPSKVFESGKQYQMFAAYNPYKYNGRVWDTYNLPLVNTNLIVPAFMTFDPSDPLRNIEKYDMLAGRAYGVTINSSPELSFIHGICIIRINVRNTGSSAFSITEVRYPTSNVYTSITSDFSGGGRYYGETIGTLAVEPSLTINPGETAAIFIPAPQMSITENSNFNPPYVFELSTGEVVSCEKKLPIGTKFSRGKMYSTYFDINAQTNMDGSIPPITDQEF